MKNFIWLKDPFLSKTSNLKKEKRLSLKEHLQDNLHLTKYLYL